MVNIIGSGAEATISLIDDVILKHRIPKDYRHPFIDGKLRKFRTRREAKVLQKLEILNFPAPRLKEMCDSQMHLLMDFVKGSKVRDVLHNNPVPLAREIGQKIGFLHKNDIIHGDLTTSNMILDDEVKFIDFGLSFFSNKFEDKAVDLHLLKRALESKHFDVWDECFESAILGYKEVFPDSDEVLSRLEKVESRGRNKNKH